jgi:hypothetical protein
MNGTRMTRTTGMHHGHSDSYEWESYRILTKERMVEVTFDDLVGVSVVVWDKAEKQLIAAAEVKDLGSPRLTETLNMFLEHHSGFTLEQVQRAYARLHPEDET